MTDLERLEALARSIAKLSPADQLRLCAELLESGRGKIAEPIVRRISQELTVAIAMSEGRL